VKNLGGQILMDSGALALSGLRAPAAGESIYIGVEADYWTNASTSMTFSEFEVL
jgi:hypothetical protein